MSGLSEIGVRCGAQGYNAERAHHTQRSGDREPREPLEPQNPLNLLNLLFIAAYLTPPFWVIPRRFSFCDDADMSNELLSTFSNQLADAVDAVAPAVVQVQGRRRPVSGLVYAENVVVTTARALGRGDALHVRRHDGRVLDAELAGWDPATSLAVLRVPGPGCHAGRSPLEQPHVSAIWPSPSRDPGATP